MSELNLIPDSFAHELERVEAERLNFREKLSEFFESGPPFDVGSSRVDLQACKLEYSIVSPK